MDSRLLDAMRKYLLRNSEYTKSQRGQVRGDILCHEDLAREILRTLNQSATNNPHNYINYEYKGSAYEGLLVGDIEFDMAVIVTFPGPSVQKKGGSVHPGYYPLSICEPYCSKSYVRNMFKGDVQRALNALPSEFKKFNLILREHGPAVQVDVHNPKTNMVMYTFDLTPTIRVDNEFYIPRAIDDVEAVKEDSLWTKSYFFEEKQAFKTIDRDQSCRKQSLRILKAIRLAEPNLQGMSSYHVKTALLNLSRQGSRSWSQGELHHRVVDLIRYLANCFGQGSLPNHFNPDVNTLARRSHIVKANVRDRLEALIPGNNQRLLQLLQKLIVDLEKKMDYLNIPYQK